MSGWSSEYAALEKRVVAALREDLSEAEFDALAMEVHAFQARWNQPFANFCATKPTPKSWREIPAVPQSAFKRFRLSGAPPEAITKTFRTSGTTGEGFGEHHFVSTRLYDAAILAGWQRLLLPKALAVVLTPAANDAPFSSLTHMFGVLSRGPFSSLTHMFGVLSRGPFLGEAIVCVDRHGALDLPRLIAALNVASAAQRPVALLGTALSFLNVFEKLNGQRIDASAVTFALETGGYKGSGRDIAKADLYAMFSEYLGLAADEVINEYGMTELSSQFYTRGLDRPHEGGPWVRALVIDPEAGREVAVGEAGVLRLFDLANLGSVLAIETQDLAIRRERGFSLLGRDPGALPRGCSRAADERMRG